MAISYSVGMAINIRPHPLSGLTNKFTALPFIDILIVIGNALCIMRQGTYHVM
jgi:hypothetical protein